MQNKPTSYYIDSAFKNKQEISFILKLSDKKFNMSKSDTIYAHSGASSLHGYTYLGLNNCSVSSVSKVLNQQNKTMLHIIDKDALTGEYKIICTARVIDCLEDIPTDNMPIYYDATNCKTFLKVCDFEISKAEDNIYSLLDYNLLSSGKHICEHLNCQTSFFYAYNSNLAKDTTYYKPQFLYLISKLFKDSDRCLTSYDICYLLSDNEDLWQKCNFNGKTKKYQATISGLLSDLAESKNEEENVLIIDGKNGNNNLYRQNTNYNIDLFLEEQAMKIFDTLDINIDNAYDNFKYSYDHLMNDKVILTKSQIYEIIINYKNLAYQI